MAGLGGKLASGDTQPKSKRHLKSWFSDLKAELSSHSKDKNGGSNSSSVVHASESQAEIGVKAASDDRHRQEQVSSVGTPQATGNGTLLDKSQSTSLDVITTPISRTQEIEHTKPIVTAPTTPQTALSTPTPTPTPTPTLPLPPISDLWNQAYNELREKETKLIKDYETALSKNLSAMVGSTVVLSGSHVGRREQMATILSGKMDEVKKNTWKLKFGESEVPVRDLMEPVVGIVDWANDYITGALSANPYASIAWAGVGLLLPLFLNPSKQTASLVGGLSDIADLIVQSSMREALYARRYESEGNVNGTSDQTREFAASHTEYRNALQELYLRILKFQATSVCYYSKNGVMRTALDMVKWNDWDSLLADVKKQDTFFCSIYDLLKDTRDQEEFEALVRRHGENLKVLLSISSDVSGLRNAIEDTQRDAQRAALLDWLSSVDPSENHRSGIEKHTDSTGEWLLSNNKDFDAWKTTSNSILWLHGKAGSGKSVLCSSIIDYLEQSSKSDPETALAFFYFSFNDGEKQSTAGMLSSLIKQLCCRRPDTPKPIEDLRQYMEKSQRPDIKTLERTLAATIRGFATVNLVIDGLDECPNESRVHERKVLLESLRRIHNAVSENLHLLCTSRSEADIDAVLRPLLAAPGSADVDLSAERQAVDADIGLYIDSAFASEDFASWPDSIKGTARDTLIDKADGMFQYIASQLDVLQTLSSQYEIEKALNDLPTGLDATYDRMLQAMEPSRRKQVSSCLKWLAFSLRPLLLVELAEIFILDQENPMPFDEHKRLFKPEDVLRYLSSLITATPVMIQTYPSFRYHEIEVEIRLAHFSIKEYLVSEEIVQGPAKDFSTSETDAHLHILESCLAYHIHLSKSELMAHETIRKFQLWDYVGRYWTQHMEKVPRESWTPSATSRALEVFTPNTKGLLNMIRLINPDGLSSSDFSIELDRIASPLYYAVALNALQLTSFLIQSGVKVDETFEFGRFKNALQVASEAGNEAIVQLLLDSGADANIPGSQWGNALQAAAYAGHAGIVRLLLYAKADANAQGWWRGNALQVAAFSGDEKIVQLLLDAGADANANSGLFETALEAAAVIGQENVVKLLLDAGADVNVSRGEYGNVLQAAAFGGFESIVRLLLEKGASPNVQGGFHGTALRAAAFNGYESIVELLIAHGAEIDAKAGELESALIAAVIGDNLDCAKVLLSHGAKVDAPGPEWEELLVRVGKENDAEMINQLRQFQENPTGYLEKRRAVLEEFAAAEDDDPQEESGDEADQNESNLNEVESIPKE